MAIVTTMEVLPSQLWPQGDARDPLGVWAARLIVTGDASAGSIKVGAVVPASRAAAYVYTAYAVTYAQLTGTAIDVAIKCRLLTGWPDADPTAGVQGFATARVGVTVQDADFTAPLNGLEANQQLIHPNDRFILLFDPRPTSGAQNILEIESGINTDTLTYAFEAYGYYWDRAVMDAPGGPRHPGSS